MTRQVSDARLADLREWAKKHGMLRDQGGLPATIFDVLDELESHRSAPPQPSAPQPRGFINAGLVYDEIVTEAESPQPSAPQPDGTDAGALAVILDEAKEGPWKPDDGTSLWFYNEAGDQLQLTGDDVALLIRAAQQLSAPQALDVEALRFAKALTEYGTHHGDCPYESWSKGMTRCKCGLFALLKDARSRLPSEEER